MNPWLPGEAERLWFADGGRIRLPGAEWKIDPVRAFAGTSRPSRRRFWDLARDRSGEGEHAAARVYAERALALESHPARRNQGLIILGTILERGGDFAAAAEVYGKAFDLPQTDHKLFYALNNSRAHCLNRCGRHRQAAFHCRSAIMVDPLRPQAHRNLGEALEGLEHPVEAALAYLTAAELHPASPQALESLEDLVALMPDIARAVPDLAARMAACAAGVGREVN